MNIVMLVMQTYHLAAQVIPPIAPDPTGLPVEIFNRAIGNAKWVGLAIAVLIGIIGSIVYFGSQAVRNRHGMQGGAGGMGSAIGLALSIGAIIWVVMFFFGLGDAVQ